MLISSKSKNHKIVLGLLNYTFPEGEGTITDFQEIIDSVMEDPNGDIFLYRHEKSDNYIGIMVVEYHTLDTDVNEEEKSTTITIQRYGVVPSFRDDDIEYQMYKALRDKFPHAAVIGTMSHIDAITTWGERYNQEQK